GSGGGLRDPLLRRRGAGAPGGQGARRRRGLRPRGPDQDRDRRERTRPQHARPRRGRRCARRVRVAGRPARRAAHLRGPRPRHPGRRAGAQGRLHDRPRPGVGPGRLQTPLERVRHRLGARSGHARHHRAVEQPM
ncbi:MAG: Anti-sigma B factor RsbT, partial [uncultured Acetobacteraceae bacterium]